MAEDEVLAEEETHAPNAAVILNYSQTPVNYESVPKVWLTHPDSTEEAPVLVPFTYGEAVSKTVEPDFSGGDMVVPIADGELVTDLTIKKPANLLPENIVKDVEIAGVAGTSEGGGGGGGTGGETESNTSITVDPEWIDDICFWDYDGTLILHFPVEEAAQLAELPVPPTHDGLTFLGWNYTLEQVQATEYPLDVGAMYIPTDGKTHLHLSVTNASYRAVPFNWSQSVAQGVSINWGDGTAATTVTGTGVVKTTHTYSTIGEYDVTITVADGCVMTLGGGTASTVFVGSGTSNYKNYLTELFIGNNVSLGDYALSGTSYLSLLTIPNTIDGIPAYGLQSQASLSALIIPNSVTSIGNYGCCSLGSYGIRLDNMVMSIPESIVTFGTNAVSGGAGPLRLSIPKTITVLPNFAVYNLYRVRRVFMSDAVTAFGSYNVSGCNHLEKFKCPTSLVTMGDNCLYNCYALTAVELPDTLTTIGNNFLYYAYSLRKLRFPRSVTTVGTYCAYYCYSLNDMFIPSSITSLGNNSFVRYCGCRRITFEGTTVPSGSLSQMNTLAEIIYLSEIVPDTVRSGNYYCEIYVPDIVYDEYRAKVSADYQHRVHKLSEYPGELPSYESVG